MGNPLTDTHVAATVAAAFDAGRFTVIAPARLEFAHGVERELVWELFRGRLLDATQTRQRQRFRCWDAYWVDDTGRSDEPLVAVQWDEPGRRLHVTRAVYLYAWQGYDAGDNVIQSREVRRWVRELVATLDLDQYCEIDALRRDLEWRVFQAVVGTSRLPLTSVEAPLPAFTLGKLGYFPESTDRLVVAKQLEFDLRSADTPEHVRPRCSASGLPGLLLTVFDEVALSPYTDFVDRVLTLLQRLDTVAQVDFLGALLRRIGRHLTAFDLVTFHHRGANYPDALLLDAVFTAYLRLAGQHLDLFAGEDGRLRRRALRQGLLLRWQYEGLPVPAVPTSPGENQRVLPPAFPHLSDAEILDPTKRTRHLFAEGSWREHLRPPNSGRLLSECIRDLESHPAELRELGTALFLDRPLGHGKHPLEPDQTILLSYIAFSRSVAERRVQLIAKNFKGVLPAEEYAPALDELARAGVPIVQVPGPGRPGVPSLQDAFRVAGDFVLLATTRRSVGDFLQQFDLALVAQVADLGWLQSNQKVLIVSGSAVAGHRPNAIVGFDAAGHRRLELEYDPRAGHTIHGVIEAPARGLQLIRTWEAGTERDWRSANVWVTPTRQGSNPGKQG